MNLVIVESPAKAKTIEKYLGKNYEVLASFGHIRDLPSKNGSVDPDNEFKMSWSIDTQSKKRVKDIETSLKKADKLILATDPDREGEKQFRGIYLMFYPERKTFSKEKLLSVLYSMQLQKSQLLKPLLNQGNWTWNSLRLI